MLIRHKEKFITKYFCKRTLSFKVIFLICKTIAKNQIERQLAINIINFVTEMSNKHCFFLEIRRPR